MAVSKSSGWRLALAGACAAALPFAACDNVGRAFDPGKGKGGTTDPANQIRIPAEGSITRSARPRVVFAGPTGSGLPATTPVVVVFDESMNQDSITDSANEEEPSHLFVRDTTNQGLVGGTYNFLLNGRMVIFRPAQAFTPALTYEVVVGKTVRDLDRQTSSRQGVVATFTADGTPEAGLKVVTSVPIHNDNAVSRLDPAFFILSGPVDATTVTGASAFIQTDAKVGVQADISFPIRTQNVPDPRVIRILPRAILAADTRYELEITDAVKIGEVSLNVGSRRPFARFTTIGPVMPLAVRVGNPTAGFANRVNTQNLQNLNIAVDVPADTKVGDKVTVRIYGDDPRSTESVPMFEEASATAGVGGASTVTVSFAGRLGTPARPTFKDGSLTIAARTSRGSDITGYIVADNASQDTVAPTLTSIGPPSLPGTNVTVTDLNAAAIHGRASERVGGLALTVGAQTLGLFGSNTGGRFMSAPFILGRSTVPTAFTLTLRDAAGNAAPAPVSGTIVQRGLLAGSVTAAGTLTVDVYDDATLRGVSGATVLIEPGMPQKPATGRKSATTDASGRAVFTGLTQPTWSITVVQNGYDLTSVLATGAGFASLPIRPRARATATLGGNLVFLPGGGAVVRAGVNLLEDAASDWFVQTTSSAATRLTGVAVRPNRPLIVTAFSGVMPPVVKPTFGNGATLLGAISGGSGANQPPPAPVAGGANYAINLALLPSLNAFVNYAATYSVSLAGATGLDTTKLARNPTVSIVASMSGFGGMVYLGPGFATGSGASWTIDGSYSLPALLDFAALGPLLWSSVQAEDTNGSITRIRALFSDPLSGRILPLAPVAAIPTVTAPAGSFTGSPSVQIADRLSASVFAGAVALRRLRATDKNGRRWKVLYQDVDAATGTDQIQLPDLAGTTLQGLATGTWKVRAEDILILGAGLGIAALNFEDLPRLELSFARSAEVAHEIR